MLDRNPYFLRPGILKWARWLERNLPPQIQLVPLVIIYDPFDHLWIISPNWITDANYFQHHLERRTRDGLEERYKDQGSAKIRNGEYLLRELQSKKKFTIGLHAWGYIMKPGRIIHVSIKFPDVRIKQQCCPHCHNENETILGQPTTCIHCGTTYECLAERIKSEALKMSTSDFRDTIPNQKETRGKTAEIQFDLRLVFKRLCLTKSDGNNAILHVGSVHGIKIGAQFTIGPRSSGSVFEVREVFVSSCKGTILQRGS